MSKATFTGPKYRLYSAHDTNIANILKIMVPTYKWPYIQYASNIYFELYKTDIGSFKIRTMHNGEPLKLEGCSELMCDSNEFFFHMR